MLNWWVFYNTFFCVNIYECFVLRRVNCVAIKGRDIIKLNQKFSATNDVDYWQVLVRFQD